MIDFIDNKYRVLSLIGSGGMAQVYKVVYMPTGKSYALKMLKEELCNDKELLRRFEKEAKASLRLNHKNIVKAYSVGDYKGRPYLLLEYVEGDTLKDYIAQRGRLSPTEAVGLACQILDALQEAHSQGIIHRDIKPQNVIVNSRGEAKLADFGIAREVSAETRTFDGKNVLGSVHYISPEQAQGQTAGAESDLYSVGVTLYELLTGDVPFKGETTVATALMHISNIPTPPIALVPTLAPALNRVVLKAMEKEADKRYHTAKAMRQDLVRCLTDPDWDFTKTETGAAKRKTSPGTLLLVGVIVPVVALFVVFLLYVNGTWGKNREAETVQPSQTEPTVGTLYISAAPKAEVEITMPYVLGLKLDDALYSIRQAGITEDIYVSVRYGQQGATGTVIEQSVESKEPIGEGEPIGLLISREAPGKYTADLSFTLSIPNNNARLRILYRTANGDNIEYSYILFENSYPKQDMVNISTTLYSNEAVTRTVYLYVDGELLRTQDVKFD